MKTPWAFDRVTSLILDAIEEAFNIVAPGSRGEIHAAIVKVLSHFTIPKTKDAVRAQEARDAH